MYDSVIHKKGPCSWYATCCLLVCALWLPVRPNSLKNDLSLMISQIQVRCILSESCVSYLRENEQGHRGPGELWPWKWPDFLEDSTPPPPHTPSSPLKMIILVMYKSSPRHDRGCVVHHGQQNDGSLHWVSILREMRSNTRDQGSVAYGDTTDDGILSRGMRIQKHYRSRTSNLLYTFRFSPSICGEGCTTQLSMHRVVYNLIKYTQSGVQLPGCAFSIM